MITDIDEDAWLAMEEAAFIRKVNHERHRIAIVDPSGLPAPAHGQLDVFLGFALGNCRYLYKLGTRYFAKQADMRWRQ